MRTRLLSLFSSGPVFSKRSGWQVAPQEKELGSENTSQRFSKAKWDGCRSGSVKGRNLHIKMYVKIWVKKLQKKALSFTSPISSLLTLLLHTIDPLASGSSSCFIHGWLQALTAPLPPRPFSFHSKKALFYLRPRVGRFGCFFGTINKRSNFFLLVLLAPTYQSG